jgi:hypothetical protein
VCFTFLDAYVSHRWQNVGKLFWKTQEKENRKRDSKKNNSRERKVWMLQAFFWDVRSVLSLVNPSPPNRRKGKRRK